MNNAQKLYGIKAGLRLATAIARTTLIDAEWVELPMPMGEPIWTRDLDNGTLLICDNLLAALAMQKALLLAQRKARHEPHRSSHT